MKIRNIKQLDYDCTVNKRKNQNCNPDMSDSLVTQTVKNPPEMRETWVLSPAFIACRLGSQPF